MDNEIKLLYLQIENLKKDIKFIDNKTSNIEIEYEKKLNELEEIQKKINSHEIKRNIKLSTIETKNFSGNLEKFKLEEQITEDFKEIQSKINLDLNSKYKSISIEKLLPLEKNLTVSHLIVKKLHINEEIYINNNLNEKTNLFENLNSIGKIGKLNYNEIKLCGPSLLFKLDSESTLKQIKIASCEIFQLDPEIYNLYDDSFDNLECVLDENIQQYYNYYTPFDQTLPPGQIIVYLIEKLKNQKELISVQERSLNRNDIENHENMTNVELELCNKYLREGKILNGLYFYSKNNLTYPNELTKNSLKSPEHNIIIFIIVLLLIIFSFISISSKYSKIRNWSQTVITDSVQANYFTIDPTKLINNIDGGEMTEIGAYIKEELSSMILDVRNEMLARSGFIFYGFGVFRFFINNNKSNCYYGKAKDLKINNIFNNVCYELAYKRENYKNKSKIKIIGNKKNLTIEYVDKNYGFKHWLNTPVGHIDNTGNIISFTRHNRSDLANELRNSTKNQINNIKGLRGVEMSYTLYNVNTDIFITHIILCQLDSGDKAKINIYKAIPFLVNFYEKLKAIEILDILRIIFTILILITIIIDIINNFKDVENKSIVKLLLIILNVVTYFKNVILIISFILLCISFKYNIELNINSDDYDKNINNEKFIDFYYYADRQNTARSYDQIAFLFIFIYFLKYFQIFTVINIIDNCLAKCTLEFFFLLLTIISFVLGLSFITYSVYGIYLSEFSTYSSSIITNIKLFIFCEDTYIIEYMRKISESLTTVYIIFYIIFIKFFLLNLFCPIFTEYLRIFRGEMNKINKTSRWSFKDRFYLFVKTFFGNQKALNKFIKKQENEAIEKGKKDKNEADTIINEFLGEF